MTITLEFTPDEEALLLRLCQSQGIEPAAYVHRVLRHDLERGQHEKKQASIALLQSWMDEELSEDESDEAIASWEENMESLDEHRLSSRFLFHCSRV